MTVQIALLLLVIGIALVFFSLERLPADVVALGLLLVLILAGLLPPEQAFASFGSDTVILIFGLLVLTASLVQTGAVSMAGRTILRITGQSPYRLLAIISVAAAALSAVMSNTAATALFVPITLGLARQTNTNASKLLMPLAFASILASSVTLVSSSTNLVISGLMTYYGLEPLGMLELTLVGVPIAIVGLIYMLSVGYRLIPERGEDSESPEPFGLRPYLVEILVLPDSPLIGKTLLEAGLGRDMDLTVLRVLRDKNHYLAPKPALRLRENDELLVKGQHNEILKIKDVVGVDIKADVELSDPRLQTQDLYLVEAIVLARSPLIGQTLKSLYFRQRYGLQVLGINRRGKNIYRKLSQISFQIGDQLLIQGPRANIVVRDQDHTFQVLGSVSDDRPNLKRAPVAIATFVGVLVLATLNILPLPVAVLFGTLVAFVSRCISPQRAYREVEWKAIIVIGSMLAMGSAMEHTGTAAFLAAQIVAITGHMHPLWLLTAFFVLTLLLTQPMSNQAAAVVVIPVALQTAIQAGLNSRTFAIMIAVGASCSFITPLEPSCLMVYGPGRYKFTDFVQVGFPLTVLIYLVAIALVPLFWPL
ncbi:MAG: SLC13 family permease [Anaerolineae bacterium]|nr:SLC13 family permease [Anaerolineae bacterium]